MYTGIMEVIFNEQEMCDFYEGKMKFDLLQNQYLIIKNESGKVVDSYKYDGKDIQKIRWKAFENQILNKVKPRNEKQALYFDLLCDEKIVVKMCGGVAGSGKSYLATAFALMELQRGKFEKLVVIRNNIDVAGVPSIGAVPGTETEKLKGYCAFMTDIVTPFVFDTMMQKGSIEVAWLGNMRGRNLENSIVFVSEAQNLSVALVKMIISRIGEGSILILDFDIEQIDHKNFVKDNGAAAMIECLKGNPLFGYVKLDVVERSAIAKLAELIK